MKDNMLIFKDKETHTEIRYVIAYYARHHWYHYLDFSNIELAKEQLIRLRKMNPNRNYGLFEKIENVTISKMDEEYI